MQLLTLKNHKLLIRKNQSQNLKSKPLNVKNKKVNWNKSYQKKNKQLKTVMKKQN